MTSQTSSSLPSPILWPRSMIVTGLALATGLVVGALGLLIASWLDLPGSVGIIAGSIGAGVAHARARKPRRGQHGHQSRDTADPLPID